MTGAFLSRREFVAAGAGTGIALATGVKIARSKEGGGSIAPFKYCLNTSTIRGHNLPLGQEIEVAAKAGYNAVEPWVAKISDYANAGGNLSDLRKRIEDLGLTVESAVAFHQWIVDDDTERAKAVEQAKRDMDILAKIGGKRIAAPPAGATNIEGLDLMKAAQRYRVLLETGDSLGVVPQIELWGFSKNLCRLGQCMFVVIESGHPKACLLPDVYHIYKGGSDFTGLKHLSPHAIQVFHINDYPAQPPRDKITDRDRVYPGDGIAPLTQILRDLRATGSRPVLSLELFNPVYWKEEPLKVAKTGLERMRTAVAAAFEQA